MTEPLVGELVRHRMASLSPSERKLARVLLASYPIAGLETLARFAERAGVSPPTVTRFITKLGLSGYPEFQSSIREEVQARLSSPLYRYEHDPPGAHPGSELQDAFTAYRRSLEATLDLASQPELDEVSILLADGRRQVYVIGGRVSGPLARYLASQLHLLRPGTHWLESTGGAPGSQLIDLGKRDVLVAFDYRRYQTDTIVGARMARGAGATVVVFTDPWLSPAAASARQVLVSSVETMAPFDSLIGPLALVETLIAAVLSRLGERAHGRMRRLERVRRGAVWGEDDGSRPADRVVPGG